MKKYLLLFISLLAAQLIAQPKQFVSWKFSQKKISANEFELQFKATIEKGWHLYSQIETPDIIVKKDGSRAIGRILEDNEDNIKYRKANSLHSPVQTISKKNIDKVLYAEGPLPTT